MAFDDFFNIVKDAWSRSLNGSMHINRLGNVYYKLLSKLG